MTFLKKHSFKIAVLAVCLAMGIYLLVTSLSKPEESLPVQMAAPAFALTDIDGNEVTLESTNGKARLVYFYFANCPDVCPPTTFLLSETQDLLDKEGLLGDKVELISITFDPERDTPDAIRAFAKRNFAEPGNGWLFLRGEEEEATLKLSRDFGVGVLKDEANNAYTHMNVITLVDKKGQIRKWIDGSDEELTAEQLAAYMKRLAKE
ncbi:SCO family protein [Paenibacillus sp. NEAU-GSW1]|uniref:SCO family protein n=1 Tax=Paenibacillus sp. NEAU-GSW1 TaxID=2682486 RepID=UPI0012E2DE7A|nr:SCO family protein [Paenibacillus sp. NEAU-GSW1]MUT67564.1 redoxin family protein [Paenibacillus sp. NEAU-GSW1]